MTRPNIVYILMDDLGYGDVSCYGAQHLHTPHIDQLSREGMRFSDAHAPSAVCTPSRYGTLTGRYCWRTELKDGVLNGFSDPLIDRDQPTIASFLQGKGYHTACIGKWHLGLGWQFDGEEIDYSQQINHGPVDVGFDYFYGTAASLDMPPYCFVENRHVVSIPSVEKEPKDFSQADRPGLMSPEWKDEDVNTVLTQKALAMINNQQEQRDSDDPFFLYLSLTGPHTPWKPAASFKGKSGIGPRGDLILEMDWTVGQVIHELKEQGMFEDTLVILSSDNGPHPKTDEVTVYHHQPSGPYRGQKSDIWEGGHRVPLIVSYPPMIQPDTVHRGLVCLTDIFATCASLLKEPLTENMAEDSVNFLDMLAGVDSEVGRDCLVSHSLFGMYALRYKEWKLILGQGSGGFSHDVAGKQVIGIPEQGEFINDGAPGQLYDMSCDPLEEHNVYVQYPEIVSMLTEKLIAIIQQGHKNHH